MPGIFDTCMLVIILPSRGIPSRFPEPRVLTSDSQVASSDSRLLPSLLGSPITGFATVVVAYSTSLGLFGMHWRVLLPYRRWMIDLEQDEVPLASLSDSSVDRQHT
jgi:hypothetical protein